MVIVKKKSTSPGGVESSLRTATAKMAITVALEMMLKPTKHRRSDFKSFNRRCKKKKNRRRLRNRKKRRDDALGIPTKKDVPTERKRRRRSEGDADAEVREMPTPRLSRRRRDEAEDLISNL